MLVAPLPKLSLWVSYAYERAERSNPGANLAAHDALEEELALASLLIEARTRANLKQAELASKMGTSQSTIARLESGKAAPSLSTLRRLAKATGTRLEISFEPARSLHAN